MVIGVMFSGIVTGLAATIGALVLGFPLWLAVGLYPVVGTLGALGYIGLAFSRWKTGRHDVSPRFAAGYH